MKIDKGDQESWIPFPRKIKELYLKGVIKNKNEYLVYMHLRLSCNKFGVCYTNVASLRSELLNSLKENTITKILHSLKNQNLIRFERRQGRKGSFQIKLDFFFPNEGKIILFDDGQFQSEEELGGYIQSEVDEDVLDENQRFKKQELGSIKDLNENEETLGIRGSNIDKDIEIDNVVNHIREENKVENFDSVNEEEKRCKVIAKALGEEKMSYVLSVYMRYGIDIIEKAYEVTINSPGVIHRGKYFNKLVSVLVEESPSSLDQEIKEMITEEEIDFSEVFRLIEESSKENH